jgi:hypothetical protein
LDNDEICVPIVNTSLNDVDTPEGVLHKTDVCERQLVLSHSVKPKRIELVNARPIENPEPTTVKS